MKYFAGTAALAAIALTASVFTASVHAHPPTRVRSSALLFNGQIRCSVSIATPARIGQPLRARFRLHNLSENEIDIRQHPDAWLVIKGSDGTRFDTRVALRGYGRGGPRVTTKIAAGGSWVAHLPFPVRWSGPLRIRPGCGADLEPTVGPTGAGQDGPSDRRKLPVLQVRVARTAAPASGQSAVAAVVAASGHLLDNCRPSLPGVAVDGFLYEPHGASPPMPARCSVRVTRHRGFDVAQELIVTPPRLEVHVQQAYGLLSWPRATGNWEAVAWQFVVTRDGAVPVVSSTLYGEKTAKHHETPVWTWTRSGPSDRYSEPCVAGIGAIGGGRGGDGGPDVVWVSACR